MKLRPRFSLLIVLMFLLATALGVTVPVSAQDQPGRDQRITARLHGSEMHAYLLQDLRAGDRLTVSMRTTSGNLDPVLGIIDDSAPPDEVLDRYRAETDRLIADGEQVSEAVNTARNQNFLAWDDDGGEGYAALLEYVVPASGDYVLLAGGSLSNFGRATAGDYELEVGLNAPAGAGESTADPIAVRLSGATGLAASVEETAGTLTASAPAASLRLVDMDAGQTLSVYAEATSGNLIPVVILRDFGGKAVEASNLDSQTPVASLEHTLTESAVGYTIDVRAAALPDGTVTEGDYRLLVGSNEPDVLTGQAEPQGDRVLEAPIVVETGLKILRIAAVDSANENFTALASVRMDWTDPELAFSPDTCDCTVKLYSDKEVDRFLSDVGSRWPAFTFFNQLGNRWPQSRTAAIWSDGRARYAESFSTTFQADFDFRQYPFDNQTFPIYLDLLYPTAMYTSTELAGYSEIDPAHGEDEFIVSGLTAAESVVTPSAADDPVSRMTFSFSAPRHMNYYVLQVFLPILLIIMISWFTFFLRDYTRRIEASAANVLLFIAFSWSLADNYPRLGYVTFLDAVMAVTFAVNALVLLYNVIMKRLETKGMSKRVLRIDDILDWAYPLMYFALIGLVALMFF